jgi:hypothetical protein
MSVSKSRASKGVLLPPIEFENISREKREEWLRGAANGFVCPSKANKQIFEILLNAFWPDGYGVPGPIVSEKEIRACVDQSRAQQGLAPYKDVFRRLRELQGEEGFTCIIKEGTKYQLQSLNIGSKRLPRETLPKKIWVDVKSRFGYKCTNCGAQEPSIKLSPDHKVPRAKGGGNESSNWQPLCEQCNNIKSSTCRGCDQNCYVCSWAFPETYKQILITDDNKALLMREATNKGVHQAELANNILRNYFNKK